MDQTQLVLDGVSAVATKQSTTFPGMPTTFAYIPDAAGSMDWVAAFSSIVTMATPQTDSSAATTEMTLAIIPASQTILTPSPSLISASFMPPFASASTVASSLIRTHYVPTSSITASTNSTSSQPAESSSVVFGLSQQIVVIGTCIIGFVIIAGAVFTYLACCGSDRKERRKSVRAGRGANHGEDKERGMLEKDRKGQDGKVDVGSEVPASMLDRVTGQHTIRPHSRRSVSMGPVKVAPHSQDSMANRTTVASSHKPNRRSRLGHVSTPPQAAIRSNRKRFTFGLRNAASADDKASARASIETFTSSVASGPIPFHNYAQIAQAGGGAGGEAPADGKGSGQHKAHPSARSGQTTRKSVHPGDIYPSERPGSATSAYSQATAGKDVTKNGLAEGTQHSHDAPPQSPVPSINVQMCKTVSSDLHAIQQDGRQSGHPTPSSRGIYEYASAADDHNVTRSHSTDGDPERSEILYSPTGREASHARCSAAPSRSMPIITNQSPARMPVSPTSKSLPIGHVKSILKHSRSSNVATDGAGFSPSNSYGTLWDASVGDEAMMAADRETQNVTGTSNIRTLLTTGLATSPETIRRESIMSGYYKVAPGVQPLDFASSTRKLALPPIITAPFPVMSNGAPSEITRGRNISVPVKDHGGQNARESMGYKRVMSVYATYDDRDGIYDM